MIENVFEPAAAPASGTPVNLIVNALLALRERDRAADGRIEVVPERRDLRRTGEELGHRLAEVGVRRAEA